MAHEGRVLAISRLIDLVGPVVAADMVVAADRKHRMLFVNGCEHQGCPVCSASPSSQAPKETS